MAATRQRCRQSAEAAAGSPSRERAEHAPVRGLLADAEAFEDVTEKIVGRLAAGDLLQRGAGLLQIEQRKLFGDLSLIHI